MASKYVIRQYNGDDAYSWAVFERVALRGLGRGIVFHGQARPVVSGCTRKEANGHRKRMQERRTSD